MPVLNEKNISICYETFGKATDPVVMFVMGITGQLINWPDELIQGLADTGFYVIIFDNRDVGLSTYFDDLDTPDLSNTVKRKQEGEEVSIPYTLEDMASDLRILMDGLRIKKAHIVGISMGGQIAQIFAIQHADRLLSLTLIATSSGDSDLPPPNPEVLDFFFKPKSNNIDRETAANQHIKQYQLYNHPEDFDLDDVKALYEKAYRRAYHPAGNKRQLLAMVFAKPRGARLRSVLVPSLVIHGDYDPVAPLEHGKQLAECLPNSHLLIIEKMGHGLPKRVCAMVVKAMIKHFSNISLPGK